MDINKDLISDLTPQAPNLLEEFGLHGDRPFTFPRSEPVQNVMELDGVCQVMVNGDDDEFQENLHQFYSMVIAFTLGEKDSIGPSALFC